MRRRNAYNNVTNFAMYLPAQGQNFKVTTILMLIVRYRTVADLDEACRQICSEQKTQDHQHRPQPFGFFA